MSIEIMRRIPFSAGHRLYRHGGKCEFFHGHNYVAEFHVVSDTVDDVGRVIDFADLKLRFKSWIDENWDHGFLLSEEDENGIDAIRRVEPSKYFVLPYNPTAENLARYLLEEVVPGLLSDTHVSASKVVIWETENASASVSAAAPQTHQRQPTPSRNAGANVQDRSKTFSVRSLQHSRP